MGKRQSVKPGVSYCSSSSLYATAGEEIAKHSIVVATASSGGRLTVMKANATAAAQGSASRLFITTHYTPSGGRVEISPGPYLVTDADTSGESLHTVYYLSNTDGAPDSSAGTTERMVGNVIEVSATAGSWLFDGSFAPTAIVSI